MTILDQLGVALGLATLAGLNLYLTVLATGCAVRFHWLELDGMYQHLAVLANPWVLGVAAGMYIIEFFADKVPWIDSFWDLAHTVVRPAGAVCLALAALGKMDPALMTAAALLAGTASLATHGVKSGTRVILNLSPEPISNSVASVAEDGVVLGGLAFTAIFPAVAFFLFIVVVVLCVALASWLWKRILAGIRARGDKLRGGSGEKPFATIPR